MTPSEAAVILTFAAAFDRRTVGETDARAWALALPDVQPDEAQSAIVEHYRETRDWIMPSDVERIVRRVRSERDRLLPIPPAPPWQLADEPHREREWRVRWLAAIRAGDSETAASRHANLAMGLPAVEPTPIEATGSLSDLAKETAEKLAAAKSLDEQHKAEQREAYRDERKRRAASIKALEDTPTPDPQQPESEAV